MEQYFILSAKGRGTVAERLIELYMSVGNRLDMEGLAGRRLQYSKIFLSDAQNQYDTLLKSALYKEILSQLPHTIVEQIPLNGSKVSVLIKTSDAPQDFLFHSMRLNEEETRGNNAYTQTILLFEKYLEKLGKHRLSLKEHCVRTWIYMADIDVNYEGMVRARNDVFRRYGLTADSHFIASTGIGGYSQVRNALVGIDFLTYPGLTEADKIYLKAPDHLNPAHEYGVAFERGTSIRTSFGHKIFISGTASIDNRGDVLYQGDILRQTGRLLENIGALLKNGRATMKDVAYLLVYLRDPSDYQAVEAFMNAAYPDTPRILLGAKVCRPEWLIEMECVANLRYPAYL